MSLGSKSAQFTQLNPQDLAGVRSQQVNFLQQLMNPGFSGSGGPLEQFFGGGFGSPTTPLQRQATGGISQFLNQPAPEQRALDVSMPALQNILKGRPGQGIMDALQPQFQRNLSAANQQGGRFGSSNAILRSRAVEDFNLLGAQAAQQGQQTQLQAAQMLGLLSGQAGQNPFGRLVGAAGVGQQDAMQADLETQRRIQILGQLLGAAQSASFNNPWAESKPAQGGWFDKIIGAGSSFLGSYLGGK